MSRAGEGLVGGPVGAIASQKLPGERGSAKIVEIGAGVGIPPIALVWHLPSPIVGLFSDPLILSREWQRHFADRASSGAGPTTTVVGSRCGSHTTQARSALRLGSAAKSQPPLMRHPFGYFSDRMSCAGDGLVGGLVGAIASEKLPGERGSAKIVETGAGVGIPPIALVWHLSYPPSVGLFSDRLILLCCFVEIVDRAAIRGL
jgi:hypothetical protein